MAPRFTVKSDYILVEPRTNEYWEIWETIGRLIKMPEYPHKNAIWLFTEAPVQISYDDLYTFKDFIKDNYPSNATKSKTALVVESKLRAGLAELFAEIAEDLPYKIKVFSNLKAAEVWVKNKENRVEPR
jgi:hypothetical protein